MSKDSIRTIVRAAISVIEAAGLRDSHVVAALSGGVDSVVLLHCLTRVAPQLGLRVSALHVDHGLSGNADAWAQFCERFCSRLEVPCQVVRVRVDRRRKLGLEAAAREARYAVFRTQQADAVALAHHRDDQAETLLLQLLRGAGVRGMSAMPQMRVLDRAVNLRLIRPLLEATRADIVAYATAAKLTWVEDESNTDLSLDRNFLRAQIMPALVRRFPAAPATLQRAAENAADAASLLDELAQSDARVAVREGGLDVAALAELSAPRARNLLRWFLEREALALPARELLEEALRQALHARRDAMLQVNLAGAVLRRHRGRIYVEAAAERVSKAWRRAWDGEMHIVLPGNLGTIQFERVVGVGLSVQQLHEQHAVIRPRSGGERIRLGADRPSRTLKNLLQEADVPQWRRDWLPLLFAGPNLVWVPGIGMDHRYAAQPNEPGVLPRWIAQA